MEVESVGGECRWRVGLESVGVECGGGEGGGLAVWESGQLVYTERKRLEGIFVRAEEKHQSLVTDMSVDWDEVNAKLPYARTKVSPSITYSGQLTPPDRHRSAET